jgi:FkbM family methyltransferase
MNVFEEDSNLNLENILIKNKFELDENSKIILEKTIKHIKIDVGLSFDVPHSQNWIDNDMNNKNDTVVFGFEANKNWINYITSPIKNNNFEDFHTSTIALKYEHLYNKFFIVPVALGNVDKPKYMDFYTPKLSQGCCSLLPPNPHSIIGNIVDTYKVPVFNLCNFFDLIPFDKIEYIDYLKVDVQGYDINVLKGAGKYLSEKVVYVTAEPETTQYLNSEDNSTENIVTYMRSLGFTYISHQNTSDPTFLNNKFIDKADDIYIWQKY